MSTHQHHTESRHVVIYGYTREDLQRIMKHFRTALPDYIDIEYSTKALCTHIKLVGSGPGIELLRFNMNRYQRALADIFPEEVIALEDTSLSRILGAKLLENELTIASAESCTGGAIAHKIVQTPGSSAYFIGSVVSYSNEIKARVLGVDRALIARHGAVSRQVAEEMVNGVCSLMHTDCGMATTGIAGPGGGSPAKPVGTVWIAVKYGDLVVSESRHFTGDREEVMESASNHAMMMMLSVLKHNYQPPEYGGDD